MPTFATPEPILAHIEVVRGSVRLSASERGDTVVEVRPLDPSRPSDVKAAEQARVDFRNGKLVVAAGRKYISIGRGGAVEIDLAMPPGSRLDTSCVSADVHAPMAYLASADFRPSAATCMSVRSTEISRRTAYPATSLLEA